MSHPKDSSKTPRTDVIVSYPSGSPMGGQWVDANFSRQLETELAASEAIRSRLVKAMENARGCLCAIRYVEQKPTNEMIDAVIDDLKAALSAAQNAGGAK